MFNLKKKKKKKNTWRCHYFTIVYQKSWWYDLQLLRYRAWYTEIGNFRSFFGFLLPWKPKKIKILKKWNKLLEISSFNSCIYRKQQLYDVQFLRYRVRQAEVCIHTERTKSNSLNYAYFTDMVICFEYWDIFTRNFMHLLACLF